MKRRRRIIFRSGFRFWTFELLLMMKSLWKLTWRAFQKSIIVSKEEKSEAMSCKLDKHRLFEVWKRSWAVRVIKIHISSRRSRVFVCYIEGKNFFHRFLSDEISRYQTNPQSLSALRYFISPNCVFAEVFADRRHLLDDKHHLST